MSTTHHAAAIVGCLIPRSKLFSKKKVRTCGHPLPEGNPQYCQDCGKRIYLMVDIAIEGYDVDSATINGLKVFDSGYSNYVCVATAFAEVDTEDWISSILDTVHVLAGSRAHFKQVLEPLGLWTEKHFGIWCVMWTS